MQRRIHLELWRWLRGITALLALTCGFLENAGMPRLSGFLDLRIDQSLVGSLCDNPAAPLQMKNKLRMLRAERDWTQADLAERLNVSRQTINAIETEKYDPSLPLAFAIASYLRVTHRGGFFPRTNELISKDNNMNSIRSSPSPSCSPQGWLKFKIARAADIPSDFRRRNDDRTALPVITETR